MVSRKWICDRISPSYLKNGAATALANYMHPLNWTELLVASLQCPYSDEGFDGSVTRLFAKSLNGTMVRVACLTRDAELLFELTPWIPLSLHIEG